jgi:excisionase family DNA binding protein
MPATRTKPSAVVAEVLTLPEAAAYLRSTEEVLRRMAEQRSIPARQVGGEWRFLKAALEDWLRGPPPPQRGLNEAFLAQAGTWKDDPTIEDMLRDAYRARGRSERDIEELVREVRRAREMAVAGEGP